MPAKKRKTRLPIVVIGGGPSGLLAAISAAGGSRKVILYNKNPWPGKKVSAIPPDELIFSEKLPPQKLASKFGKKSKFVAPIFKSFGYVDLVKLFKKLKLELQADEDGHFRTDGIAGRDLMTKLVEEAQKRGVEYRKSSRVTGVYIKNGKVGGISLNGTKRPASAVIIATGSFSAPKYGSTKDGYEIAKRLGHKVNDIKPALVDLITREKHGKFLFGEPIEDIKITVYYNSKPVISEIGTIKFTSNGISGPFILNHSAEIVENLCHTPVEIGLNFMPEQPKEKFETWLIQQFISRNHMQVGQFLNRFFNDKVMKAIELESRVNMTKSIAHITNLERKSLVLAIKDFRLSIKSPKPFNNTRGVLGGVAIDEINPNTGESKLVKSLYFAGDVIDILGPCGGYNMQFAFSSGYVAGKAAAKATN
jgi:predicted Rossmann fold flavoprotein